ncbi:MAG: hypothetical protein E6J91_19730 [Deltaproteobacteria bacterium]|nr:MAG: hypothetical protein E6J91_19730 [Deltaproteobacteria bacterium]
MDHGDSGLWTDDEVRGWDMHGVDDDASPGNDGEECGYLARELATHDDRDDRDADAWPWSIARPIAEQQPVLIEIVVASEPDGADTDGSLPPGAEPADTCDDHDGSAAQPGEAHATRTEGRLENGGAP